MTVPVQRHMPRRRGGHTTAVTIGGERLSLTANAREDGTLGEVFIQWGKQGTTGSGLMDLYATAISVGLRHGVPLIDLIQPCLGLFFVPNGYTDDPEIPRARSVIDYFSRRLAIDWLPRTDRAALGVFTISERVRQASEQWGHTRELLPRERERWAYQTISERNGTKRLLWELATSVPSA